MQLLAWLILKKNILIVDIVVIVVFIAGKSTVIIADVDGIIFCLR